MVSGRTMTTGKGAMDGNRTCDFVPRNEDRQREYRVDRVLAFGLEGQAPSGV